MFPVCVYVSHMPMSAQDFVAPYQIELDEGDLIYGAISISWVARDIVFAVCLTRFCETAL